MSNYIERNKKFLQTRHYVRYDETNLLRLDLHFNPLQEYRERCGNNMCVVLYTNKEEDDAYIIPVCVLDKILVPENFWPEVGENAENERKRWRLKIEGDRLFIVRKSGSNLPSAYLDLDEFHNNYELLGSEVYDWESFPPKESRKSTRPRSNRLF